jgi:predicted MFS family arabinose efflux permease
VGAVLAAMSWQTALGAQALLLPLALAGALVLDDARPEPVSERYASELGEAVRQPGMPAVLTAGFLRFVCKFALIAYLPLMLVGDRGATLAQGALVLSVASGVAAATNLAVVRMLRRVAASRLLIASVSLVGTSLFAFAVVPDWKLALVTAVAFGIGDGILMVVQNALVTEAAPERVRAGLVSVSGMTRNAGKLVAPLAMGSLILAVSVPVSFTLVGLLTLAAVPALRPVRRLDALLTRAPSIEASTLERL